jgi:hypothetical protein
MFALGCTDPASVSSDVSRPREEGLSLARSGEYSAWSLANSIEVAPRGADPSFNTPSNDGCPFISRDGKTFYIASNRPGNGAQGGQDIWVSTRESENDAWGAPVNVGPPVNSSADDFCPTIARDGHLFYFVSRRAGGCGMGDIYVTRLRDDNGFDEPEVLPCDTTAPYEAVNSPFDEFSPFPLPEPGSGPVLYFSSFRPGGFSPEAPMGPGDSDIYRSESHGGVFGPPALVLGVNSAADDGQPNVRADGLELFFYSTRVIPGVSLGGADLYVATRENVRDSWSTPINLGPNVNSGSAETRPSLSWDGTTLYFGSTRPNGEGTNDIDIYVTTRQARRGKGG